MWGRNAAVVDQVNAGVNEDYLPELRLPDGRSLRELHASELE